jgi:hypothetical protein
MDVRGLAPLGPRARSASQRTTYVQARVSDFINDRSAGRDVGVLLILDLSSPYSGLFGASPAPLEAGLAAMGMGNEEGGKPALAGICLAFHGLRRKLEVAMTIPQTISGFAAPAALMPLGVLATLPDNLPLRILGVGLVTAGFFGGHSIASSWIGLRAETAQSQASALYLFFYYLGSSVAGSVGGWAYAGDGSPGVAAFIGALSLAALAVALRLTRVPPPAHLRRG